MAEGKVAILKEEMIKGGYVKFTLTYSTGGEYVRYLAPENINQDHDLRNDMTAWAQEQGFLVRWA